MHDFPTSSVGPCGTSSELGAAFPVASRVRTLESARKLLGARYGLGYEFCAAFRAVHVRELFANDRRELDPPASSGAGIRA